MKLIRFLFNQVIGILFIICWTDISQIFTMGYTFRRHNKKLTLKPDSDLSKDMEINRELTVSLIHNIDKDIKKYTKIKNNSIKSTEMPVTSSEMTLKGKRHYMTDQNGYTVDIHSVVSTPTNRRRILLRSKSGLMLKMNSSGHLKGTSNASDPHAVFIIESMSPNVVRLKGELSQKYICIEKKGKIVTRNKPLPKCLLYKYIEENNFNLFWSYKYSKVKTGEDGWFLGLRKGGKVRKPANTKLGDKETMFYVHYLYTEL